MQISSKFNKINKYFTWRLMYSYEYLVEFFLEWEMFQTKILKNGNTHFIFNNMFSKIGALYEIMWRYIVQLDRPKITA
jgi:hypothetical protein